MSTMVKQWNIQQWIKIDNPSPDYTLLRQSHIACNINLFTIIFLRLKKEITITDFRRITEAIKYFSMRSFYVFSYLVKIPWIKKKTFYLFYKLFFFFLCLWCKGGQITRLGMKMVLFVLWLSNSPFMTVFRQRDYAIWNFFLSL